MYDELVKRLRAQADAERYFVGESMLYDAAADAIESTNKAYQMISEAYEAEVTKQNWIPVTERLPKEETVLTWGKENRCILINWMHDNKWCCVGNVEYWMPLPQPPTK